MRILALGLLMLAVPGCDAPAPRPAAEARKGAWPALTGPVVDGADMLTSEQEARLAGKARALREELGPQYVVVTVESLGGLQAEKYSLDLANHWALGDEARDDGLMLLVARKEKGVRIEVGTGLERRIPDAWAAKLIAERALPRFREGRYAQGIEATSDALIARLRSTVSGNEDAMT